MVKLLSSLLLTVSVLTIFDKIPKQEPKPITETVWVCTGPRATKYHRSPDCVGLRKCSATLMEITEEYATKRGYTPCRICAKKPFSFEMLDLYKDKYNKSDNFIKYIENEIEERNMSWQMKSQHRALPNALSRYGKIQNFSDVTLPQLEDFFEYLKDKGLSQPTIYNYIKRIRQYIKRAVKEGLIDANPMDGETYSRGRSKVIRYLVTEEIERIRSAEINNVGLQRVRDCFLFQAYTGLAYADLRAFDFAKVEERNGRYYLQDTRIKTNEVYYIMLLHPAMEILKKYDYKLPVISNQQYNLHLKDLMKVADIKKNLTTHVARHTFATFAINNNIPLSVVAKMLGHSKLSTTEIYAKILNNSVEEGYELLEKKITKN